MLTTSEMDCSMELAGRPKIENKIEPEAEIVKGGVFKNICKSPKHLGHLMRKLSGSPGWKGRIMKETRRIGVNRSEHTAWRILKNQPQN